MRKKANLKVVVSKLVYVVHYFKLIIVETQNICHCWVLKGFLFIYKICFSITKVLHDNFRQKVRVSYGAPLDETAGFGKTACFYPVFTSMKQAVFPMPAASSHYISQLCTLRKS